MVERFDAVLAQGDDPRPADSRTAQALAHPLPAARLHTNICY